MTKKQPKHIIDSLEALPILRGCPRRELEIVNSHTTKVKVLAGSILCRQGVYGDEAFIIVDGEAEVSVGGTSIARLGVGAVVGEMALLEHGFRSATVTAVTSDDRARHVGPRLQQHRRFRPEGDRAAVGDALGATAPDRRRHNRRVTATAVSRAGTSNTGSSRTRAMPLREDADRDTARGGRRNAASPWSWREDRGL